MLEKDGVDRVTLAQVAAEAGVSLSTVSKVLNGRTDVSLATRQRVEGLLDSHGYRRRPFTPPEAPLIELVFHELIPWQPDTREIASPPRPTPASC